MEGFDRGAPDGRCAYPEPSCGSVASAHRARTPLSCQRIVAAALAYVDSTCLDDLSMRRLGAELGVEAMSLYRYFPSKAALLDAIVCHVLADLELPPAGAGAHWESHVRAYARSFRAIAAQHPRLFPQLAMAGPRNRSLGDVTARMVGLWREAGLDPERASRAQRALQGFLTGASLWEVATPEAREQFGATGGTDRAASSDALACTDDSDADFEFGLDVLVAGVRDVLATMPGGSAHAHRDGPVDAGLLEREHVDA